MSKYRQFFSDDSVNIDINNSREVASEISKNGWPISHTIVSIMIFAIEQLYPFIPNLMHTGLSKVKTLELRKIKKSYESYINKLGNDSITISHFDAIWESSLANNDSDDLKSYDISNIRRDLDDAIKLRSGIAMFTTSSHIDNLAQSNNDHNNARSKSQHQDTVNLIADDSSSDIIEVGTTEFNSDNNDQLSENSSITTEENNSDNRPSDNKELTNADNVWSIVYNDAIKLASTYNFDNCLSNSDNYPGFFVDIHDSIIYSDIERERLAVWIWLRSLCFDDSELLLSGSNITITQAFDLTLYLSKARINNNKIQRLLTRIERSVVTVKKLLAN